MQARSPAAKIQVRLLILGGLFLACYATILTLSPAVRARSWDVNLRWSHWVAIALWGAGVFLVHKQINRYFSQYDPFLLPTALMLAGWGTMTIFRLLPDFGLRQSAWITLGLVILYFGVRIPPNLEFLRRYKYLWLTAGLLLTSLTLLFGTNPSGSGPKLWLGCCGFYLQPSEPLKLLLIVYLASYLADRTKFFDKKSGQTNLTETLDHTQSDHPLSFVFQLLAPSLLMTGLALTLLAVQRDLGTATIFLFIYTTIVYVATRKKSVLVISLVSLIAIGMIGYELFDVVRLRVDAWINPWSDPSGRSYQIVQSLIALAAGGMFGRGPGLGSPGLVPVAHSDFIFPAITEETGLLGGIGLCLLLALFLTRGLRTAINSISPFHRYLASGLTAHLAGQSILIIGGTIRLFPLTGVTLPFVSYGGSSLVISFIALLFLLLIGNELVEAGKAIKQSFQSLFQLGGALMVGVISTALITGWWTIIRGPDLVARFDNPRPMIADRFVARGNIFDRKGVPLTSNQGPVGSLERHYRYPFLGPVLGYSSPAFGQTGLEFSLNSVLRGLESPQTSSVLLNQIIYNQHPPGQDLRLSLDVNLHTLIESLMEDRSGAVVLLNAKTGEIFVMASYPTYDPNKIDENWSEVRNDPRSPLLNRATQGSYPLGTAVNPILFAHVYATGAIPPLPGELKTNLEDKTFECAYEPVERSWSDVIRAGCPTPMITLGQFLGEVELLNLYTDMGFFNSPEIRLQTFSGSAPSSTDNVQEILLEQGDLRVSPLQLALAAATLSNSGIRPAPRLVVAVSSSEEPGDWIPYPPLSQPKEALPGEPTQTAVQTLRVDSSSIWQTTALAHNTENQIITWYLGGTLPDWEGAPLAIAILLEENNPELANRIGQEVLITAITPDE